MKNEASYFNSPVDCPECGVVTHELFKVGEVLMCDNCTEEREEDWESDWDKAYDLGEREKPSDF
jgi:hypothetical protein